jgi:rubrerythrin
MLARLRAWWLAQKHAFARAYWISLYQAEGYAVWECPLCGHLKAKKTFGPRLTRAWPSPVCIGAPDRPHQAAEMRFLGR